MTTSWSPALVAQYLGSIETEDGPVLVCVDRYDDGSVTIQTRKPGPRERWGEKVELTSMPAVAVS